ncbi:MAG: diguanylate cyclase protein [Candidatus Angelobacter sp.]|jgi:diguanylate cyclase (GGDEF)-like protein|nr:diguanylate cyclase protein [Candidatus Angelobacter sp.]
MVRPSLLIVGADSDLKAIIVAELANRDIELFWAADLDNARQLMSGIRPNAALIDFEAVGVSSLPFISELANASPSIAVLTVLTVDDLKIKVEAARQGTRVLLQKPLHSADLGESIDRIFSQESALLARVLVMSHIPKVLKAAKEAIQSDRVRVSTLQDPMRFWETLEDQSPNLLVLDVDMPQFSGLDLCRVIRVDNRWNWLPVILVSSKTDVDTIHSIFAAGADDFVPSEFTAAELSERVWNRLERNYFNKSTFESDMLTGLTTRRQSNKTLSQFLKIAERQRQPFTFCILDLDNFKLVNDEFGHAAGDMVLQRFGKMLSRSLRSEDVIARWGGEEFVVGMYGVAREAGTQRLERLLESWRMEAFKAPSGQGFHTTFSAGIAEFPQDGIGLQQLYRAADEALYAAKMTGRNRVRSAGNQTDAMPDLPTVALYDVEENSAAILRSCFKQFGILTKNVSHDEISRLRSESFTGAVVPIHKGKNHLSVLMDGKLRSELVLYGVYEKPEQIGNFPLMLSGAFGLPLDRPSVVRGIRTTFLLLKKELRRHVRIPIVTRAEVEIAGKKVPALTQELSAGGMSLNCDLEVSSGKEIKVTVAPPGGKEVTIDGVVSWVRRENKVFGLCFARLDDGREQLQDWIDDYLDGKLAGLGGRSARLGN